MLSQTILNPAQVVFNAVLRESSPLTSEIVKMVIMISIEFKKEIV